MKKIIANMKKHREKAHHHVKIAHKHIRKHHKKYLFGILSAAFLIKVIPVLIAGIFTAHVNYSFADETITAGEGVICTGSDIDIIYPTAGMNVTGEELTLRWNLNGDNCLGQEFTIKLKTGSSEYIDLGTVASEEREFNEEMIEGIEGNANFGIFLGDELLVEGPSFKIITQGDPTEIVGNSCTSGDLEITYPTEGMEITGNELTINWNLNGDNCLGQEFTIKLKIGNSEYVDLGTVSAEEREFNEEMIEGIEGNANFGIFLGDELLVEGPSFKIITQGDPTEIVGNSCTSGDLEITYPLSGQKLKSSDVKLEWTLSGENCSGKDFIIKLYDSGYVDLGSISSNSGTFAHRGISGAYKQVNFAIYYTGNDGVLMPLIQGDPFIVDNQAPTITGVIHRFDPSRTSEFGLNDKVFILFTGSEELTGIVVNVMGINARFIGKTGLSYGYEMVITTGNNTGNLEYNISFQDIAGNLGIQHHVIDTGKYFDNDIPTIKTGISFTANGSYTNVAFNLSKIGKVSFTYMLSGGSSKWTITGGYNTSFTSLLQRAKISSGSKIYKYVISIEDQIGRKNYYGGTFTLSGNNITSTILNSGDGNLVVNSGVSVLSSLRSELNTYSGCSNQLKVGSSLKRTIVQTGVYLNIEIPRYASGSLEISVNDLVNILAGTGGLKQNKYKTVLTQAKADVFSSDLNNYLLILKMKKEPNACGNSLKMIPSLYMSKFLKTLKSYGLIK